MNYKITESYAPVLIVAFNRYEHFRKTIDSLILNHEKINTEVYICIDGPKKNKMTMLL